MNTTRIPYRLNRGLTNALPALASAALILLSVALLVVAGVPSHTQASSHREAPLISNDPQADNTDLYAFVSPDMSNTVTIVANYIPLEEPNGGPNFANFGDNVLYEIRIDNTGNGEADIVYQFRFHTTIANPETFLYNTGPITSLSSSNWNIRQTYTVTRLEGNRVDVVANNAIVPPVNIGPRSTPNYDALANAAIYSLGGRKFFAGQRDDPFFVDLGSIFDLAGLRPFNQYHLIPLTNTVGVDGLKGYNVHSIVMQVPISDLTRDHQRHPASDPRAVIGVYANASRMSTRVLTNDGTEVDSGKWTQISRLGEPLINEAIIALGDKDYWNAQPPASDKEFLHYYLNPLLSVYENVLYGNSHPGGALQPISTTNRADLETILLTGIPGLNFTGNAKADLVRLNTAIPPTSADPNAVDRLGALAQPPQLDGFPNGRRLADDVTDIELRATAQGYGAALHNLLGLPDLQPNDAIGDGVDHNDKPFLSTFPYVASPWQGYDPTHHNVPGMENNRNVNDK